MGRCGPGPRTTSCSPQQGRSQGPQGLGLGPLPSACNLRSLSPSLRGLSGPPIPPGHWWVPVAGSRLGAAAGHTQSWAWWGD